MTKYILSYSQYGSHGILIEWPQKISDSVLKDRVDFGKSIQNALIKQKVEIIHAYSSLLIIYNNTIDNFYSAVNQLKSLYNMQSNELDGCHTRWVIPVCYEDDFAVDLEDYSTRKQLSKEAVIHLHTTQVYKVYFIGFLPGFLYLGGLDKRLHLPRKSTPSLTTKKGSVAIGGSQTGIYPTNSPGGWHVIGNSPVNLFDHTSKPHCFAKPGDEVVFSSINKVLFNEIAEAISLGGYQLEKEIIYD